MDPSETLHQLFGKQVSRTPDALAVGDPHHTNTYRHLDQATDAMAGSFQGRGVAFDIPADRFLCESSHQRIRTDQMGG